jgi:hypothetical protein
MGVAFAVPSTTQAFAKRKDCRRIGRAVLSAFAQQEPSFAAALLASIVAARSHIVQPRAQPSPLRLGVGTPSAARRKRKAGDEVRKPSLPVMRQIAPRSERRVECRICNIVDKRVLRACSHCTGKVQHMCGIDLQQNLRDSHDGDYFAWDETTVACSEQCGRLATECGP